jgi:hypothetical protein
VPNPNPTKYAPFFDCSFRNVYRITMVFSVQFFEQWVLVGLIANLNDYSLECTNTNFLILPAIPSVLNPTQ